MEINPDSFPRQSVYKLMIGAIVPRPIGWIATVNKNGQPNLAPFLFFNAVCPKPPTLLFCPMVRGADGHAKDTLNNIRATGEFVVNIVNEPLAAAMNISSTELPPEINEFAAAGLTTAPSLAVRPPRVAESPIHFECRLNQIVEVGHQPGGGSIVIGTVVHLHIDERVLIGEDKINWEELKPIGRLAGASYCRVSDLFEMVRPPSQIKPPEANR
jgi:flavin reductase (DIM6/NTAB) family NADH-FMN oxidoreductase RutF